MLKGVHSGGRLQKQAMEKEMVPGGSELGIGCSPQVKGLRAVARVPTLKNCGVSGLEDPATASHR